MLWIKHADNSAFFKTQSVTTVTLNSTKKTGRQTASRSYLSKTNEFTEPE